MHAFFKIRLFILWVIAITLPACEFHDQEADASEQIKDTICPVLILQGGKNDTTCLPFQYEDKGVSVADYVNGRFVCTDLYVEKTGTVNTTFPGTYLLSYNSSDAEGNKASTVTRTVHVIENQTVPLNGNYIISHSCTAIAAGTAPTLTTGNYTSIVAATNVNRCFELNSLNIGRETVIFKGVLSGDSINGGFWSSDYHPASSSRGTLSRTKNTFTIESIMYAYAPPITYKCKTVCTKQLIEVKTNKVD